MLSTATMTANNKNVKDGNVEGNLKKGKEPLVETCPVSVTAADEENAAGVEEHTCKPSENAEHSRSTRDKPSTGYRKNPVPPIVTEFADYHVYNETEVWKNGLGYMYVLPECILLRIIFSLPFPDILSLSSASKALYILTGDEEVWKERWKAIVKKGVVTLHFKGSWKMTCLHPQLDSTRKFKVANRLRIDGFYSPWYSKKWYLTFVELKHFSSCPQTVERRSNLSVEEFQSEYAAKNKPVLITDALKNWPAMQKWQIGEIGKHYGNSIVRTSDLDGDGHRLQSTISDFLEYCSEQSDLDPLYIFDPNYWRSCDGITDDYSVPPYFPLDLFSLLEGHAAKKRKLWRWIVFGPGRSMTKFHIDPCRTAAWNALIAGRKRWAFYPPSFMLPPGGGTRYNAEDDSWENIIPEPLQWYVENYPHLPESIRPIECIQEPGELLFVPTGWWHSVLNLETTVAVTHNFVDQFNIKQVWYDLQRSAASDEDYVDLLNKWSALLQVLFFPKMIRLTFPAHSSPLTTILFCNLHFLLFFL